MSAPPPEHPASLSTSGYEDGLGRRTLIFDREAGMILERLQLRPELRAFEAALRARITQSSTFEDERFARVRGLERDAAGGLTVVSEFVPGSRVSDLLDTLAAQSADEATAPGVDTALGFLLELLPALGALHAAGGFSHGAITPGRIVLTPTGQVVLLDGIFGQILERLQFSRRRLWSELRLAMPPEAGPTRLDIAADIDQASLTALMIVMGRALRENEYPDGLAGLVSEVIEIAQIRGSGRFASGLHKFFQRTLPFPGRKPYATADEAATELRELAREIGLQRCHIALVSFITDTNRVRDLAAIEACARSTEDYETDAPATYASPEIEGRAWPEDTSTDVPVDNPVAAPPATRGYDPVAPPTADLETDIAEMELTLELEPELDEERPLAGKPPAPVAQAMPAQAILPIEIARAPEPVPTPIVERKPAPVVPVEVARTPEPVPAPIVERKPAPAVPVEVARKPVVVPVQDPPKPRPAQPVAPAAEPVRAQPPPAPVIPPAPPPPRLEMPPLTSRQERREGKKEKVRPSAPPPLPPPAPPAAPVFTSPVVLTRPRTVQPPPAPPKAPAIPVYNPPVESPASARQAPPMYVPPLPPPSAPLRIKESVPTGYVPVQTHTERSERSDRTEPDDMVALPYVQRGIAEEEAPSTFPWKLAAGALVIVIVAVGVGRSYLSGRSAATPVAVQAPTEAPTTAAPPRTAPAPPSGVRPKGTGAVSLVSQPAGAHVQVDGKPAGDTPITIDALSPGPHTITFVTSTASVKRTVRIEAGKTVTMDVPVFSGWIAVFSPIPLDISENGRGIGSSEQGRLMLSPGRHELTFTSREFAYTSKESVDIVPGEERSLTVQPVGELNVNAMPWAEIWINGKKFGETPLAHLKVPLGTYEVVFKNTQLGERRVTSTVTAAAPVTVTVDFNKPQR